MNEKLITLSNLEEFNTALDEKISTKANASDYYTKSNVDSLLNNKQNKLTFGKNIFMYNNSLSSMPVCGLAAETTSYHDMFRYSSYIKYATGHNGTIASILSKKLYVMHEGNHYGGAFTPSSYTINASFTGNFNGMRYGNGKYLILTDFSNPTYGFFYASDLPYLKVSFSYYAIPDNLVGLSFSNLQFIHDRFFIWNTTQMFYSFDGKDWTEVNVPGEGNIVDVIAKDLDFCIIRANTLNITSDLINFETHETTQEFTQYKTVFFKGKLFKNHPDASSLSLLYTTDYERWYTVDLNISRYCGYLFTDNDILYVTGNGLTSDFWYSHDGLKFALYPTSKTTNSGQFFSTGTMVCLFGGDEIQRGNLIRIINTKQHPVTTTDNVLYTPRQTLTDKLDEISSKYATKDFVNSESVTFKPFPEEVLSKGVTTAEFIESFKALDLPEGMAYLGHVELTDLPAALAGGEVEVRIYAWDVIYCILRSADRAPYMWELNSFENRGWESMSCQAYTLPTAAESNKGVIKQYVGETTEEFTKGYYYQVISETSTDDESGAEITTYSWKNINVQPGSAVDTSNFYTKAEVDSMVSNIDTSNYYTKEEIDTMFGDINSILATLVYVDEEAY